LKRTISGTYVSVELFHLFRYLDEQAYRYNNREKELVAGWPGSSKTPAARTEAPTRETGEGHPAILLAQHFDSEGSTSFAWSAGMIWKEW
jgi:hypothetical protein